MRILYGVQATGNGHISRARALAPALAAVGIAVDFLFSGRAPADLFDMAPFGAYRLCQGLTFATRGGRVRPLQTLIDTAPLAFARDVRGLDLAPYDLILTDFEPVTAWAGRRAGKLVIGIGHQYAFEHPIPQYRGNPGHRLIMKYFAPAKRALGLHWHHFGAPILPPIAPVTRAKTAIDPRLIVVYLPFETPRAIEALLKPFGDHRFAIYHPQALPTTGSHLSWHKPSHAAFHRDLSACNGVVANAGFELASEVLQLGCKLLVKPLAGQPEQRSNVMALRQLGLGHSMKNLDQGKLATWLERGKGATLRYPDVAAAVARWLAEGHCDDVARLASDLWRQTQFPKGGLFAPQEVVGLAAKG